MQLIYVYVMVEPLLFVEIEASTSFHTILAWHLFDLGV